MNDRLVEALLAVLRRGDESERLRSQAALSLGPVLEQADVHGFDDADHVPIAEHTFDWALASLRKLYRDADVPSEVRQRILEASVRAQQGWHPAAVRAAYARADDLVKVRVTESVGMRDRGACQVGSGATRQFAQLAEN